MWHMSSRSGVATLRTAIHLLLTYLLNRQNRELRIIITIIRDIFIVAQNRTWCNRTSVNLAISLLKICHYLRHEKPSVHSSHFTALAKPTRSSAIAEGPRDASCQLKSCQLPRNGAETTCTTSPEPSISCR